MNATIRFQIRLLITVLVCAPVCLSQNRQSPRRPAQTRIRAPFLQQAKSYEETTYVTKVVFKNGMTVLVDEFKSQPVVSFQVHVRAGSLDDPPQNPGMARLVAAMVQRGTPDKAGGTFRQKVQAMGGIIRSATDYQTTTFELIAPSRQWKRALDVQAEAVLNPFFDRDSINLEARLVQSEAREILDDPDELANEKLLELAFDQPRIAKYGSLISGSPGSYTPESLASFYRAAYTPARTTLVVSGDVSSSEVLNEVVRVFMAPSGAGAGPVSTPVAASQDGFRYRSIRGNVSVPRLFFGFHAVPENHEDYYALEVLRSVLGLGNGSVLSSRLRDQKKLILSADARMAGYAGSGFFSMRLRVKPADIDSSEIAALTEIELLKREELTDVEMERALAQLERSYWMGLETVTGRARALARFESLGDWKRMNRYLSDLRKVKASDVKRAAEKYLRLENCSLLEYLPSSGEDRQLNAEGIRQTFEALLEPAADQEQAERDKETVLAVKLPPSAGSFVFSEIQYPLQTASILRGPELFIREAHTNPVIEMGLFYPGGKFDEKKENAGITKLMASLMLRSAPDLKQFDRQLEIYGGQLRPVVADDYFGFYLSILSQNFEEGFKLLLDVTKAPDFEKEKVERQKEIQSAEILSRGNSCYYPQDLMDSALFGSFSYSLDGSGTEASLAAITPESLAGWHDAYVKNRKPVVVIIGDTKGASLAPIFVKYFSGSRFQDTKLAQEYVKPIEKGEFSERSWSRNGSMILIGFQAPPEDDEDGYAAGVLQAHAGDPGRFSQELRDRLGLAHRVSVAYRPRLRGGSLVICAAAGPGGEEDLLKALREEIRKLREGPIIYRDFRSAVNQAVGAYTIRQQARFTQIRRIAESVLAGKGVEGFQSYPVILQEVKEDELKTAVQRILNLDKAVVLRIRGQK